MAGGYRRYEVIERVFNDFTPFYFRETAIIAPSQGAFSKLCFPSLMEDEELSFALDVLSPFPFAPVCKDLVQIKKAAQKKAEEISLRSLIEKVSALESRFEEMMEKKERKAVDRKYSWTAEIGGGKGKAARKYKWTAEINGVAEEKDKEKEKEKEKERKKKVELRSYKWIAEIDGKDEKKTYTWKATIGGEKAKGKVAGENKKTKKKAGGESKGSSSARIVEIEEPASDHRAVILRQAFARRAEANSHKGKRHELSPQDAAMMIQMSFRDYLIRRSRALRALRELAVAKAKLKEIRALFHNYSYRNRVARDAEERQKFAERIIVLLLTVDAIEGADLMARSAKRSMVDELEAMLDVVDPQPPGRSLSMRRRMFDMPSGDIQKEIAEGVAQVVKLIGEDETASEVSA